MSGIFSGRADKTVWKGGWREIGGYRKYYRSRWEANYARWLEKERLEGRVQTWAHEPKTFWFEGIRRGVNNYLPDFHVVYPDGKEEYHEVKGWMDAKSATKIKRMGKYFPEVKLVIVDRKVYNKLERECRKTLIGWEEAETPQKKEPEVIIPPLVTDWTITDDEPTPEAPPKKGKAKVSKKKLAELEKQLQ